MSRTRAARTRNSSASSSGRPNSLTRVAPGAENRSVIWVLIAELWSAASRRRAARRLPIRRAGTRKTGSMTTARTVTSHEVLSMTIRVRISATRFVTTPDSVPLKACWAPITSLLRRLTSAPVRVRVKNAMGIFCTWSKTAVRRSRITPSPIRAEYHRVVSDTAASATATRAMTTASRTIVATSPRATMTSTT